MYCYHHSENAAVIQCSVCGKGLCRTCALLQGKDIVCKNCAKRKKTKAILYHTLSLGIYALFFYIGYRLNFMAFENIPNKNFESGYMLMAIISGWQFINKVIPFRLFSATILTWGIYGLLKLFVSAFVGIFTAPFTILWNLFKLVKALMMKIP